MKRSNLLCAAIAVLCIGALLPTSGHAVDDESDRLEQMVARVVRPVMNQYGIPGMAVGIVTSAQRQVYNYGLASKATGNRITDHTLFEIGSDSKTFTATLAAYAAATGKLAFSDMASKYLPSLRGSSFDRVSLLNLGTHTAGGLPLQVPDQITNNAQLMAYFQGWKPIYPPGSHRVYSNPSIGLLGVIAAKSLQEDFVALMEGKLFPWLGLKHTYLIVPPSEMENYAQGYTSKDVPIRMAPGILDAEAYGVRTTASDLLRFVQANLGMLPLDGKLQRAIFSTHTGYYRLGPMTQDLIWEQYPYPVALATLLAGNSARVAYEANPVTQLDPPLRPQDAVLINKTGSTNGFAAYVAFIPARKIGLVLMANRNYPIPARVTAAFEILRGLDGNALSALTETGAGRRNDSSQ